MVPAQHDQPVQFVPGGDGQAMGDRTDPGKSGRRPVKDLRLRQQDGHGPGTTAVGEDHGGRAARRGLVAERVDQLHVPESEQRKGGGPGGIPVVARRDPGPQLVRGEQAEVEQAGCRLILEPGQPTVESPNGGVPVRFGQHRLADALKRLDFQPGDRRWISRRSDGRRARFPIRTGIKDNQHDRRRPSSLPFPKEEPQIPGLGLAIRQRRHRDFQGMVTAAEQDPVGP